MPCTLPADIIGKTISFHGHSCPGLAIGIRASELAFRELGSPDSAELVAISETDMCGVDGIQFITGCTVGKGNFLQRDYGKMAFSFYDRKTNLGFRALLKPEARSVLDKEMQPLMKKVAAGSASSDEKERLGELRGELQQHLMAVELDELFEVTQLFDGPPRPARILESLECQGCGESTMESRTRRLGGETFCIPCFEAREQKV